jgi:hypothetical protein
MYESVKIQTFLSVLPSLISDKIKYDDPKMLLGGNSRDIFKRNT